MPHTVKAGCEKVVIAKWVNMDLGSSRACQHSANATMLVVLPTVTERMSIEYLAQTIMSDRETGEGLI